jgi:hypothetical protein
LDRLTTMDINHLTPLQAINLLHEIKSDIQSPG